MAVESCPNSIASRDTMVSCRCITPVNRPLATLEKDWDSKQRCLSLLGLKEAGKPAWLTIGLRRVLATWGCWVSS
ncbi:hypothetical protein V8C37DRAFT_365977 [Trichoderma ceciliae]